MKRANEILNSVKSRPNFKSIQKYSCYNKLLELLPPRFKNAIAFFYIKNNTLFGALSHPGYKMELNYNKDLVKGLLNQISLIDKECNIVFKDVKKVEFFVSKFFTPKEISLDYNTIPFYKELSTANFEVKIKDKEIKSILEKIKEDIKINREREYCF